MIARIPLLTLLKQAEENSSGPPNYRDTGMAFGNTCAGCKYFDKGSSNCSKYQTPVKPSATCDSFEPIEIDMGAIQNAKPIMPAGVGASPVSPDDELKFGSAEKVATGPWCNASYRRKMKSKKREKSSSSLLHIIKSSSVKEARAPRPDQYKNMNNWLANIHQHPATYSGSMITPMSAVFEADNKPVPPELQVDTGHPQSRVTSIENWKSGSTKPALQTENEKMAFKRGFLLRCAEENLSVEQTHQRIKQAVFDLGSAVGGVASGAGSIVGKTLGLGADVALAAALGIPLGLGVAGGAAYNQFRPVDKVEDLKKEDVRNEYYRLADVINRKTRIREMQQKNPGSIVRIA